MGSGASKKQASPPPNASSPPPNKNLAGAPPKNSTAAPPPHKEEGIEAVLGDEDRVGPEHAKFQAKPKITGSKVKIWKQDPSTTAEIGQRVVFLPNEIGAGPADSQIKVLLRLLPPLMPVAYSWSWSWPC